MENITAVEAKLITLVNAMNDLQDNIDPDYGKVAVFAQVDSDKSVRYFIKKRPVTCEDGIQRWSFVARKEC